MSTELSNIVNDDQLIGYLDNLGLTSKLTQQEKNTYINIAKAFGLNPFKREIHVSKYGENLSIITGYEVYIKRAERSGQLDGWNVVTSGTAEQGDLKAIVTIHRKDRNHPFIWEALYSECVQKTNQGVVTKFWQKAAFMTKKVAISQAFRLCFSDELGGMPYTADEINDNNEYTEDITHVDVSTGEMKDPIIVNAISEMEQAANIEELKKVWSKHKALQKDLSFIDAKDKRKKELE